MFKHYRDNLNLMKYYNLLKRSKHGQIAARHYIAVKIFHCPCFAVV